MAPRADLPRRPIVRRRASIWAVVALALVTWFLQRSGVLVSPNLPRAPRPDRPPVARDAAPDDSAPADTNSHPDSERDVDERADDEQRSDDSADPSGERWPDRALAEGEHRVERVVDGDTLVVDKGARVRLIGVNTPESVKPDWPVEPFGPEASAFTKKFVAGGRVRLTFDRERVDEHGRYLAYLWVGEKMLNEELLRNGLGHAVFRFPYSEEKKRRFRRAQEEAQRQERGIWSEPDSR